MIPLTSNPRLAAFVLAEANGQRSRENVIVVQTGAEVLSGTVLAMSETIGSTASFQLDAAAAGDPTIGAITVGSAATPGTYTGEFTSATAYELRDPSGAVVDDGATGVAFDAGGLGFTITAGSTAAEVGDLFTIVVTPAGAKYIPYTADSADGEAAAVLYSHLPAATGEVEAVAFVRDCEVNRLALIGLDNVAEADLETAGIKVRGGVGALSIHTPAL